MFSRLTIWLWTTNWCALPGGSCFSHSQVFLVSWGSSSCRVEALRSFPTHFSSSVAVVLVQQSVWWSFLGVASDIPRDTVSQPTPWSLALTLSTPSSSMFPEAPVREFVIGVATGTGLHSSAFDPVWFALVVSLARTFCDEGWRLPLLWAQGQMFGVSWPCF